MVVIVPGSASSTLAASLSSVINAQLVMPAMSRFADGEISIEFPCGALAPDAHVVIMQSLCSPANDNMMELLLLIDAVRRARVPSRITVVIPYLCYSRQDRVMRRNEAHGAYVSALSAKVVANIISRSGIDHVVTVDLHSSQATGFFDIPFTSISSHDVFVDYLDGSHLLERLVVVAPDYGALGRVRSFVRALSEKYNLNSIQVAVIDKYREGPGVSEVMHVVGNVKDRHCFILDDIVDSGGTLCNAAAALKARGAVSVHGYITHGVLSGRALETVEASELDSLVITDTIEGHGDVMTSEKVQILTIAGLLGNYLGSHLG